MLIPPFIHLITTHKASSLFKALGSLNKTCSCPQDVQKVLHILLKIITQ